MYSFIIGTLSSKGKYILHFQSGYTLTKEDILLYLFRTAEDNQIDVLEFNFSASFNSRFASIMVGTFIINLFHRK